MKIKYLTLGLGLIFGSTLFSQTTLKNEVTHVQGTFLGITKPVSEYDVSVPFEIKEHNEGDVKENRKRPEASNPKALPEGNDPLVQESFGTKANKAPYVNFNGLNGATPPDPSGAAGPNHYVQTVNSTYRVFDKTGTPMSGILPLNTLWAGSSNDGDPIVMYDRHADKWVITQFQYTGGNKILFAVSTTPDPLGSYATYSYSFSSFPDYPKYSIWSDGYYMTSNSNSQNVVVFDREAMINAAPTASYVALDLPSIATHYGFKSVLPADADGALPPYGTPNYLFYFQDDLWSGVSQDAIKILKFQVNWATPSSSTVTLHQTLYPSPFNSVFTTSWADIEQKGTTQKIDAIASVFNYRAQYIRWGTTNTVMLCNVVDVNNANKGGIRWYELRQNEATNQFSIFQEGTYAPDGDSRFLGSIAMDLNGNIGLAYSISGPDSYPSLGYTGRHFYDTYGQMTAQEYRAQEGVTFQSGGVRFGDYSQLTLDPDGNTFWYTGEYIGSGGSRKTKIFSFDMISPVSTPQYNLDQIELKAYQNGELLNVEMEGVQFTNEMHVELIELNGKTVRSWDSKIENGKLKLSWEISSLAKGTYIVGVSGNTFLRTQKIVIQ